MDFQTQGVILSYKDYKEADRLITIYSRDLGKLQVVAQGVRKIKAKLAGHLELFNLSDLQLIARRNSRLLVTSAINCDVFFGIKAEESKLDIAFALSRIADEATLEEQRDERIFNLIVESFKFLDSCPKNCELVYYYFVFNLLVCLGYQPVLKNCLRCGNELNPEKIFFSFSQGGIVCDNHRQQKDLKMMPNTLKILRLLVERNPDIISKLDFKEDVLRELKNITQAYLQFTLGINTIKSKL